MTDQLTRAMSYLESRREIDAIHVMRIVDPTDFDRVLHESAHPSALHAELYARNVAMAECQLRVDPEYRDHLYAMVERIEWIETV